MLSDCPGRRHGSFVVRDYSLSLANLRATEYLLGTRRHGIYLSYWTDPLAGNPARPVVKGAFPWRGPDGSCDCPMADSCPRQSAGRGAEMNAHLLGRQNRLRRASKGTESHDEPDVATDYRTVVDSTESRLPPKDGGRHRIG